MYLLSFLIHEVEVPTAQGCLEMRSNEETFYMKKDSLCHWSPHTISSLLCLFLELTLNQKQNVSQRV